MVGWWILGWRLFAVLVVLGAFSGVGSGLQYSLPQSLDFPRSSPGVDNLRTIRVAVALRGFFMHSYIA